MKDWIERFDVCSTLITTAILLYLAYRVAKAFGQFQLHMIWTSLAVLLFVATKGLLDIWPFKVIQLLQVLLFSVLAAAVTALVVAVLLPPLASIYQGWQKLMEANRVLAEKKALELKEQQQKAENQQREAAYHELEKIRIANQPKPVPPPPPLTMEERAALIRTRFDNKVVMLEATLTDPIEKQAAINKAKQEMLRDLNKIM